MVKLERFIVMKTRPFFNIVKKWANRAKGGVKLIVGWIKTKGNNNTEIKKEIRETTERPFPPQSK